MLRNGGTDVTIQVLFNWYINMSVMKISRRGKSKATYIHEPITCFTYKKKTFIILYPSGFLQFFWSE